MKRIFVTAVAVTCLSVCQASAVHLSVGLLGNWPLDDGSGDIARNLVTSGDGVFKGATGVITNAETGGAHPTEADGLASVWVQADDFPLGPRTVWSTGGQGARGAPNTFHSVNNPGGELTTRDTAFIEAGRIPQMGPDNEFTWAFWAKTDEKIASRPGQFAGIVGNRYADQDHDTPGREDNSPLQIIKFTPESFEYHYSGSPAVLYNTDALGNPTELNNIVPGEWHHHTMVKNGDGFTYYRDGVRFNRDEKDAAFDVDLPLFFGGDDAFDDAEQWHGFLSDVAIWGRRLLTSEVRALAAGHAIVPEPSSVALVLLGLLAGIGHLRGNRR
ncbi:MAG: LamG-like jellyroll fold domain-containing protein [Pirellulales bacterium]